MNNYPLVSVIIPMFRRLEYVGAAVESVRRQTYPNVEIIVVDDGSGEECLAGLRLPSEVRLLHHADCRGPATARNTGVRHARGQYIAFLDSDDLWLPDKLATQVRLLQEHPDAGLTYCTFRCIDSNGEPLAKQHKTWSFSGRTFSRMQRFCFIKSPTTVLMPRHVLEACGPFDADLSSAEDWDLWLKVAWQYPILADPTALTLYRVHPTQLTRSILKCRQKKVAVRKKWLEWAQREAPEWTCRLRRYYAADLQRLARAQVNLARDISGATHSLDIARRMNPWDLRVYLRLLRVALQR
ncbi:MAG: glycosyltransferase family 2 protein [Armatimonadota bacterium]